MDHLDLVIWVIGWYIASQYEIQEVRRVKGEEMAVKVAILTTLIWIIGIVYLLNQ